MPKAKPSSVSNFRIELQETERDALGLLAGSQAFRNIGQGIGAILDPILDNIVEIMAIIIANEGIDWLLGAIERADERYEEEKAENAAMLYQQYLRDFEPRGDPDFVGPQQPGVDTPLSEEQYYQYLANPSFAESFGLYGYGDFAFYDWQAALQEISWTPQTEGGHRRATWWQNNVGAPIRSAGNWWLRNLKLW